MGSISDLSTRRILVADEDHRARGTVAEILQEAGHEVLETADAEEALQLAMTHQPELMLVDSSLKGMPLHDLVRWLSQLSPATNLIVTSAELDAAAARSAVRCGVADYLVAPATDPEGLTETVNLALESEVRERPAATASPQAADRVRVEDMRRRFLSAVAHELRTPLTVIKSFASVLAMGMHGQLNEDQAEVVEHVQIEADRLAHEVGKLLSLARLENEDFTPDRTEVTLGQLVAPIEKRLRAHAAERRVDLTIQVGPAAATLLADPQDISQALLALAENGIKFCGDGGRVHVSACVAGEHVEFRVHDNGVGIHPRDQERIFEMFVQIENPLTRRHGGCGIGLTYAARIVESHGSKIRLRSEPGEGTEFSFRLPLAPEAETASTTLGDFFQQNRHA